MHIYVHGGTTEQPRNNHGMSNHGARPQIPVRDGAMDWRGARHLDLCKDTYLSCGLTEAGACIESSICFNRSEVNVCTWPTKILHVTDETCCTWPTNPPLLSCPWTAYVVLCKDMRIRVTHFKDDRLPSQGYKYQKNKIQLLQHPFWADHPKTKQQKTHFFENGL